MVSSIDTDDQIGTNGDQPTESIVGEFEDVSFWKRRSGAAVLSVAAFLTFYVLSAGPMVAIHRSFEVDAFQDALGVIYKPLVFIVRNDIEPMSSALKWYIELFQ